MYECVLSVQRAYEWMVKLLYLTIAGAVIAVGSYLVKNYNGNPPGTEEALMAGCIIAAVGAGGMIVVFLVSAFDHYFGYSQVGS